MSDPIPVYFNRSEKLSKIRLIAVILVLPVGLFLWGWYQSDPAVWILLTIFSIFVSGGTLLMMRKTLFVGSEPVFTIRAEGIEIVPNKVLLWSVFKDAVVFTYEGDKMMSLRLRDNLSPGELIDLHSAVRKDTHYQMLGLPLTVLFNSLTLSGEEVLQQFKKHGLPVCLFDQDIHFGQESELRTAPPDI